MAKLVFARTLTLTQIVVHIVKRLNADVSISPFTKSTGAVSDDEIIIARWTSFGWTLENRELELKSIRWKVVFSS